MALLRSWVKLAKRLGKCNNSIDSRGVSSKSYKHINPYKHELLGNLGRNKNKSYGREILEKEVKKSRLRRDESSGGAANGLVDYCDNILGSVEPAERENIMERIWIALGNESKGDKAPTLEEYNALLKVCADYSQSVDPYEFLKGTGGKANAETHKLLLKCAAKSGNVPAALYVLSLMKGADCLLNEEIFNSLIELYARAGDIESALLNLQRMRDCGIEPSSQTWTNVARAHAAIGDIEGVEKILKAEKDINDRQIMDIAGTLLSSDNKKYIQRAAKYLSSQANLEDSAMADSVIELVYAPNGQNIHPMVDRMTSEIASDRRDKFLEHYLKTLVRAKIPIEAIFQIIDDVRRKKKYSFATADVCEAALENGESQLAMRLFERMAGSDGGDVPLRAHYYWPLLIEAWRSDGEAGIFRTIEHMLRLNVRLDQDTLFYYVFPRTNISDIDCTLARLRKTGVDARTFATPLMRYLLTREENFENSLLLCAKYGSMIDFSKILDALGLAYRRNKNIEKIVEILKYAPRASGDSCYPEELLMNIFGKMPRAKDVETIEKFIETFDKFEIPVARFLQSNADDDDDDDDKDKRLVNPLDSLKIANKILHPRDMNVDQLECHLVELRSKGMNKRGVLRKLLMIHCRGNDVKRVNELKKEYEDNGYLWSSGLYSVLFSFYARYGEIEEATRLYQLLREYHKHFNIDPDKLVLYANALIENKQIEAAINVLESSTVAASSNSKSNEFLSKQCWRLLDTVAHSEFSQMTQPILDILVKSGYCRITNAILGPVIRQHLSNDKLEEAVESFKTFAQQYKLTPLRQELILAILESMKKSSNDSSKDRFIKLMEEVRIITANIHCPEQSNADFFLGLARARMRQELIHFSFENNPVPAHLFIRTLEYIPEDEKLSTLNEIFDNCTTFLPYSHTKLLSEQMISLYSKSGDCQGAIQVCRKMMKANVSYSRTFLIRLVNLLKSHRVPIPQDLEIPCSS